jgi:hypothetical protein
MQQGRKVERRPSRGDISPSKTNGSLKKTKKGTNHEDHQIRKSGGPGTETETDQENLFSETVQHPQGGGVTKTRKQGGVPPLPEIVMVTVSETGTKCRKLGQDETVGLIAGASGKKAPIRRKNKGK